MKFPSLLISVLLPILCADLTAQKMPGPVAEIDHPLVEKLSVASPLLTAFWKKPVSTTVSVLLPAEYAGDTDRRYPVRYNIAGLGGRYDRVGRYVDLGIRPRNHHRFPGW